jgi:hypothetical protein
MINSIAPLRWMVVMKSVGTEFFWILLKVKKILLWAWFPSPKGWQVKTQAHTTKVFCNLDGGQWPWRFQNAKEAGLASVSHGRSMGWTGPLSLPKLILESLVDLAHDMLCLYGYMSVEMKYLYLAITIMAHLASKFLLAMRVLFYKRRQELCCFLLDE